MLHYILFDTTNDRPIGEPIMKLSNAVFLKLEFYEDRPDVIIKPVASGSGSPNEPSQKETGNC